MGSDRWSAAVVSAAAEVHKVLGPGLLESVYRFALSEELRARKIPFEREMSVPIRYRDLVFDAGLRLDFVVGGELIVEVKSVARLTDLHEAHVFTCLKLSGYPAALLVNFNVPVLRRGVRRLVLHATK